MIGICGVFNFQRQDPVLSSEIKPMARAMRHRGAGKIGLYLYQNIGLGAQHEIPRCQFNCQPLASADETVWVMLDGEFDNYHELRNLPRLKKYRCYSDTHAELLLYLYREFKEGCAEILNGAFAFVIWNKTEKRLMLARDPLGKRSLYYAEVDGRLFFASEMKALLKHPRVPRALDVRAVNQYLHNGFVLAPDTVLTRVKKIAAGHFVTITAEGCQVRRYWEYRPVADENAGIEFLKPELLKQLESAVATAVNGQGPLGILLSGGLDSGLLVALARQFHGEELLTFNLRLASSDADDRAQQAQLIHQRYKTRHFELLLSPEDFIHHFVRAVWYQDEPVADPALVAQFQLYQFVKLNLDTVLSAEGLDELFGGKEFYLKSTLIPHAYYFTGSERKISWNSGCQRLPRVRHWGKQSSSTNGHFPIADRNEFNEQIIYSSQFWLKLKSYEEMLPVNGRTVPKGALEKLSYFEINDILPDRTLLKNDRFCQAIALNLQLPFFNKRMVDLSSRIPASMKINQMQTKYILRLLAQEILPESVVWQRQRGWQVPLEHWLMGSLIDWPTDLLLNQKHFERGLFNPERLRQLVAAQAAGEVNASRFIYALLYLETWFGLFLDDHQTMESETVAQTLAV